jgi:hypothetical protein
MPLCNLRCFNSFFSTSCLHLAVFLVICIFFGTGCSQLELSQAFRGELATPRSNKVISQYCASCHIHKAFDSKQHVSQIRMGYKRTLFRRTTECRVCHFLEKRWINNAVLRKTRRPREVNRGYFIEFEKGYRKSKKSG